MSAPRSGILCASLEVVHRLRSDSPLHIDSPESEEQRVLGGETLYKHIKVKHIFFQKE